jgi:rhodanese-related sulfurtransferase
MSVQNLSPVEVAKLLAEDKIILIDVREPAEFAADRIAGAQIFPLSSFNPAALPSDSDRPVVFHCAGGVRSAKAAAACQAQGIAHNAHMTGGIQAWKAAGLPVVRG